MKAWRVEDLDSYEGYSTVVFAETRSQAKLIAMSTDACEDAEYIRIRATRIKDLDSAYRGLSEMDWYDDGDRTLLVKHGWGCIEAERWMCESCAAGEFCDRWQDRLREEGQA